MALRLTPAGMLGGQRVFRRLKTYRQLLIPRNALHEHMQMTQEKSTIETVMNAA